MRLTVYACKVAFIPKPGHHATGRGTLVIYVPLSARRPHWVTEGGRDVAYVRAGAHSLPMRLQTFLDMHSRTDAQQGEVVTFGKFRSTEDQRSNRGHYTICPRLRLLAGPIAKNWALELRIPGEAGRFSEGTSRPVAHHGGFHIAHFGTGSTLFPMRLTEAGVCGVELNLDDESLQANIVAVLYIESAPPVSFSFSIKEFRESSLGSDPACWDQ